MLPNVPSFVNKLDGEMLIFVSLALRCQLLVHVVHARDPRLVYENVALKYVEHCVHHNQPTVLLDYWLESFPEQLVTRQELARLQR
jgi:hypothetical protein